MNAKTLGTNLLILGVVLLIVAACWWAMFYGPIVHRFGGSLTRVTSCLYSQGGLCGMATGFAQIAGQSNPYNPIVCWAGAGFSLIGAVVRLSR